MAEPEHGRTTDPPHAAPVVDVVTQAEPPADVTAGADDVVTQAEPPADVATDAEEGRPGWRFVGSLPFLVIVALCAAILIKSFLVQAFFIPSESMEPTLMHGDRVLVNKLAYVGGEVGRSDVVVFANPNGEQPPDRSILGGFLHWLGEGIGVAQPEHEDYIKRVVGLPGETVAIRSETVFIDDEPLDEPYLTAEAKTCNRRFGPVVVPADSLFVMGDNRCNSADSRYGLGFVPQDKVVGRAFVIIWPPGDLGGLG